MLRFLSKFFEHKQKLRPLIGQTAITSQPLWISRKGSLLFGLEKNVLLLWKLGLLSLADVMSTAALNIFMTVQLLHDKR
jgi:hypothetical protein